MTAPDSDPDLLALPQHLADVDDDRIDFEELARQIGTTTATFTHATTPGGEDEPWLDKVALWQAAGRHLRNGGEIDFAEVVEDVE